MAGPRLLRSWLPAGRRSNRLGRFASRFEAGRMLGGRLGHYRDHPAAVVLALPRGGVPVGFEVAQALGLPLDVFLVRKLGVPEHRELAMGAIASGGARVLNPDVLHDFGISEATVEAVAAEEERELARRERAYRGDRPSPDLRGRTVILVDDGLATGATMRAAIAAVRLQAPERVVVAVPTAARPTVDELAREVDELVCLLAPEPFLAVGLWYADFSEPSEEQIRLLLARARASQTQGTD